LTLADQESALKPASGCPPPTLLHSPIDHHLFAVEKLEDKYLVTAYVIDMRAFDNSQNGRFDEVFADGNVEPDFVCGAVHEPGTLVIPGNILGPRRPDHAGHRHQIQIYGFQLSFNSFQSLRLDDCGDKSHGSFHFSLL